MPVGRLGDLLAVWSRLMPSRHGALKPGRSTRGLADLQQVRDDDRGGGARAGRAARLLRRRRAAEHRGQPRQAAPSRRIWSSSTRPASSGRSRPGCRCRSATRRSSPARPRSTSMFELFGFYLQGGLIDVGFLGAAQIDRLRQPQHDGHRRLRSAQDAAARALAARARSPITRSRGLRDHAPEPRSFVERIDFRTSPATSAAPSRRADPARAAAGSAADRPSSSRTSASTTSTTTARCGSTRSIRARRSSRSARRWAGTSTVATTWR